MSRHPNAVVPGEGQESVWDYPRPPRLEPVRERIVVRFAGQTIADTVAAYRVLETSHPPVYYLPPGDLAPDVILPAAGTSFCEFKGTATYVTIVAGGRRSERAGWRYASPTDAFRPIAGFIAFYAAKLDEALVGGERVRAATGDFLWRLDYRADRWTIQGRTRHVRLVSADSETYSAVGSGRSIAWTARQKMANSGAALTHC